MKPSASTPDFSRHFIKYLFTSYLQATYKLLANTICKRLFKSTNLIFPPIRTAPNLTPFSSGLQDIHVNRVTKIHLLGHKQSIFR